MRRVELLAVGRLRDVRLRSLCDDYLKRCAQTLTIHQRDLRNTNQLVSALDPRASVVVLDERGEQLTSRQFAKLIARAMQDSSVSRLIFAIGGADGFDEAARARADVVLSLGKMTFAHQLARVMLAEQLYRAVSILEGAPYHRE